MLKQKVDQKKNFAYIAVLILIILIIVYIFFKDRIFKPDDVVGEENSQAVNLSDFHSVRPLESSFLKNDLFGELKDNRAKRKTVGEIVTGKNNPFVE